MSFPEIVVDPRNEADAQIARALQIVVDAGPQDEEQITGGRRDYTPGELGALFFSLSMAMVQLKKLPGGREARDRSYARAESELARRGRHDVLASLSAEANRHEEAVRTVKRAYGDDIDLSFGTTGHHLVQTVTLELEHADRLRSQLIALAAAIRQPETHKEVE